MEKPTPSGDDGGVETQGQATRPSPTLPDGFVAREEAARISGIGITAWERWEAEGKVTCGQWWTMPRGGRRRIFSVEGILQMMRDVDVTFPPPGTVDRREAARMFGAAERTFSQWERQGRITCGRSVAIPGKPGHYKVYPVEELRRLADALGQQKEEAAKRAEPYADPDRPGVVRVPVSSDKHTGMEAIVDADALPLVRDKRWNWSSGSNGRSERGSVVLSGAGGPLARIITGVTDAQMLVSHVNGDRLDYRRENLIVRTRSEVKRAAKRPVKWEGFEPYADPDRPGVVRVPVLSDKHEGMEAIIDAGDLPLVRGKRWNWSPGGKIGNGTVVLAMVGTPKPSLARMLLGVDDPGRLVCHRNRDRLDCRRENLIVRTRSEVKRASKKVMVKAGRACSSRFKGVTRTESGRKWQATIHVAGEYRNLGRYRSEVDAAQAYDAALRELMGADAPVNLPDPAEADRLRAAEPVVEIDPTWPPPGMADRHEACRMFGVSLTTWIVWERRGRITCGQYHPLPNDKPGRCKLYPRYELERTRLEIEKLGKPYADPDRPGVWRVPLKGYLTYREVLIDEADLPVVNGRNWNWSPRSDDGRTDGVVVLATTERQTPLHRMITGVVDPKVRVAFVNGDALDCRRANLAVRTLAETVQGTRKASTRAGQACTSRFKGVCWHPGRGQWKAQIAKNGIRMNVGRFESEADAAAAYDAAARVLFGEHGHLNFPDRPSTERAMAEAQLAMDDASNRKRVERRRQRDLERELRRAAAEATPQAEHTDADGDGVTVSRETAEQLFDVSRSVWRRWQCFGWLPASATVDGQTTYRVTEIERLLLRCGIVAMPYPDPQRPGAYRVPLFGETAKGREALIDADAVPLVQTRRWRFAPAEAGRGGEVQTMIPSENVRLHYVVMGMTSDAHQHLGHRNDDPLDCRRANLVVRTLTDTGAHKRKSATYCGRPCTSRFKGVWRDKRRNRWVATIKKERIQHRLGSFHDEIAAAEAYDESARELFGEHARLNFPDGVDARLADEAAASQRESRAAA